HGAPPTRRRTDGVHLPGEQPGCGAHPGSPDGARRSRPPVGNVAKTVDLESHRNDCDARHDSAVASSAYRSKNIAHSHFTLLPRQRSQDAAERIRAHVCNVLAAESPKIVPAQHVEHLSDQFDPRAPTRNDRLADSEVALTQPVVVNLALRNWREIQGGTVRVDRRQHGSAVAGARGFPRPGHVVCGVVAAYTSAATRALPIS